MMGHGQYTPTRHMSQQYRNSSTDRCPQFGRRMILLPFGQRLDCRSSHQYLVSWFRHKDLPKTIFFLLSLGARRRKYGKKQELQSISFVSIGSQGMLGGCQDSNGISMSQLGTCSSSFRLVNGQGFFWLSQTESSTVHCRIIHLINGQILFSLNRRVGSTGPNHNLRMMLETGGIQVPGRLRSCTSSSNGLLMNIFQKDALVQCIFILC
mmetsp:Transcript_8562/g.20621  ORF Transcript_8562/g.20621 Transcript_8562/m.20621 type:complete len:209 (+) Transcript_8562:3097-3723(+)